MVLCSKVKEACECQNESVIAQIPTAIRSVFEEELILSGGSRRLYVTLGQFSIVRLERDAQLVVPVLDYAVPEKECCDNPGASEDPCEMFSRIPFPTKQFTPQGCDRTDDDNCRT